MKSKLMTGVSLMLMVALVVGVFAVNAPTDLSMAAVEGVDPRLVSVQGLGEIVVTPDLAFIDIGVQTKNADAAVAQKENAKLMAAVVEAIKAAGIKAEDIKTTGYNLYQTYDYVLKKQIDPYFIANNTLTSRLKISQK